MNEVQKKNFLEKCAAWLSGNTDDTPPTAPAVVTPAVFAEPAPVVPPLPVVDTEKEALKAQVATLLSQQSESDKAAQEAITKFKADNAEIISGYIKANKITTAESKNFTDGKSAEDCRAENPVLFDAMIAKIPADTTFSTSSNGTIPAAEVAAKLDGATSGLPDTATLNATRIALRNNGGLQL